jgi:hypothetical protein
MVCETRSTNEKRRIFLATAYSVFATLSLRHPREHLTMSTADITSYNFAGALLHCAKW